MWWRATGLVCALAAAGCFAEAGGDGRVGAGPDARLEDFPAPDGGGTDGTTAILDNECGVAAQQGDVGDLDGVGTITSQGNGFVTYRFGAPIPSTANDPKPDVIYVELWEDYGVFQDSDAQTGTFTIGGAETVYETCGVCVFTFADVDPANGPSRALLAQSGTISVLSVGPDGVAVDVTNAVFEEVDADDFEPEPGSNCPSPLAHAGVSAAL